MIAYSAPELLSIYNTVIARHGLPRRGASQQAFAQLKAFGVWCNDNGVDPAEWITDRHQQLGWKRVIPIKQLPSTKFLRTHRSFGALKAAHNLKQDRASETIQHNAVLFLNDLRPIGEIMKRQLAIDPESCLFQMDLTGGWNPRSPLCAECPVADRCSSMLSPDVLAKRRISVGGG